MIQHLYARTLRRRRTLHRRAGISSARPSGRSASFPALPAAGSASCPGQSCPTCLCPFAASESPARNHDHESHSLVCILMIQDIFGVLQFHHFFHAAQVHYTYHTFGFWNSQTHLEDISDKDGELPRVESRELLSALVSRCAVVWVHGEEGEAHQARVLGHCGCPYLKIHTLLTCQLIGSWVRNRRL